MLQGDSGRRATESKKRNAKGDFINVPEGKGEAAPGEGMEDFAGRLGRKGRVFGSELWEGRGWRGRETGRNDCRHTHVLLTMGRNWTEGGEERRREGLRIV